MKVGTLLMMALTLLVVPRAARAQKSYYVWCFGTHAKISFFGGSPTNGGYTSLVASEGCSSICDSVTGEFLFASNGNIVIGRDENPMPNGTGLYGHESSSQSSVIVPMPGDTTRKHFYLFTSNAPESPVKIAYAYSIIDMTLNGGRGDVTVKNVPLMDSLVVTEHLTAVRHANGRDYWVIFPQPKGYYAFLVTPAGVSKTPVVSLIDSVSYSSGGCIKGSPDGTMVASAGEFHNFQLMKFDASTGRLYDPLRLDAFSQYGVSFSPDNSKLYLSDFVFTIYQYDLTSYNAAIINNSRVQVSSGLNSAYASMQIGPDGRLYIASDNDLLAVITRPNEPAAACGFQQFGVYLTPQESRFGLPNAIDEAFDAPTARFGISDTAICQGECITFTDSSLHYPTRWRWSFADGNPTGWSDSIPPTVCFDTPGRKRITLVVSSQFGVDSLSRVIDVAPSPTVDAGADLSICPGVPARLTARVTGSAAIAYKWSPAAGLSCTDCPSPSATPSVTTTYHVRTKAASGCQADDSVTVTVKPVPVADAGPDQTICPGGSTQLHVAGGVRYDWTPATGLSCFICPDPIASPTQTTTYRVTVFNAEGCGATDSVTITVGQPKLRIDGAGTICQGDSLHLVASGGASYHWSPAAGLSCVDCPNPVASPSVTTWYHVKMDAGGCSGEDSVMVVVLPKPVASAGADTAICAGSSITLHASAAAEQYQWSPAAGLSCVDCQSPIASPSVTTTYRLVARNSNGCADSDRIVITVLPSVTVDAGPDRVICAGERVQLDASGDASRYRWSPSDSLSCTDCQHPTASPAVTTRYVVEAGNGAGCRAFDTVVVQVRPARSLGAAIGEYHAPPGRQLTLVVTGNGTLSAGDTIEFTLRYDRHLLRIDGAESASTDWSVVEIQNDQTNGVYVLRIVPTHDLPIAGALLHLRATPYLGSSDSIGLPFTLASRGGGGCLELTSESGYVRLDSICGVRQRLIELIDGSYALDGNHPNPFNPSTDIDFSLGLDGATTLMVYDGSGGEVARLVDEHLAAGSYRVHWDATGYPSGVYRYRIVSGRWSAEGTMVLLK